MSDSLPVLAGSSTPKFLLTSEKISRWAVGLAGAIAVVVGGTYVLPYIIHFAELGIEAGFKMLVLAAVLGLIGGIGAFVLNPTVQASAWYWYMGWVDAFALRIVKINPVARVKAYVSHYLEPMKAKCEQLLINAQGREKSAKRRLDENSEALAKAKERAAYCLSHGSPDHGRTWTDNKLHTDFSVQSAKIRSMTEAAKRLEKRLAFQSGCVVVLRDLLNVITAYTEVTSFNVQMMVEEYESAGEMAEGGREVRGMLGGSEKTRLFNLTAQHMMEQTDLMMGEVESVMDTVRKQIDAGRLDDAIGEESLIRELTSRVENMSTYAEGQRQLVAGGEAALLVTAKSRVLEEVPVGSKVTTIDIPSNPSNRFKNILPR
jgi:hypothetical protein